MRGPIIRKLGFMAILVAVTAGMAGCLQRVWVTEARDIPLPKGQLASVTQFIKSPLKAHLADGSTVVYRQGAIISGGQIVGTGVAYKLMDDQSSTVRDRIPLDSVVGVVPCWA